MSAIFNVFGSGGAGGWASPIPLTTMRFRVYIAMSLDGYIATSDGGVEWLDPFLDEDYGYGTFIQEISHAVMGRVTYDHVRGVGEWPYPDLGVHVLTSG